jgi:Trk K+ transport system NAD-binding subunit
VHRGDDAFPPRGDTELQAGDRLTVLTMPVQVDQVRHAVTAEHFAGQTSNAIQEEASGQ